MPLLDAVGDAVQDRRALRAAGCATSRRNAALRGGDRGVDLGRRRRGATSAIDLAVDGRDVVERARRSRPARPPIQCRVSTSTPATVGAIHPSTSV